jgi:predicted naringenin-chalcone synthase
MTAINALEKYPAILSLETRVPENRCTQAEILEFLLPNFKKQRFAREIFMNSGIDYRHAVVDFDFYDQPRSTKARNDAYIENAIPLGEAVVRQALNSARITPDEIDDLFFVSCTGYEIPGMDLHIAGRLCMRPDLQRTCILGMGCYAAFPGLLRARQAVEGRPGRTALVVALELCSVHMQFDDTLENVICSSLFADGAAAVIVRSPESGTEQRVALAHAPRLIDSATYCDYQTFDQMAFHLTDNGFQMRLSSYVPKILAAKIETFVDQLLIRNHLDRSAVRFWGIHPGGRKILDHLQKQLGLDDAALRPSRTVLSKYGNMSSATILFVLDEIWRQGHPEPGDYGVLMAFGPGLTMESALIRW